MGLIPFLTALISQRAKLPAKLVVAAGSLYYGYSHRTWLVTDSFGLFFKRLAQCLYVLTDDNTPAVEAFLSDATFPTTLLSIARTEKTESTFQNTGASEEQAYSLRVLACGKCEGYILEVSHN